MKNAWKVLLISLLGVIAIVIFGIFGVQSFQNHAISLEEQVESASSDIKIQELLVQTILRMLLLQFQP